MDKNLQQSLKTVLISSLASVNVIVWHEIFGVRFLMGIVFVGLVVALTDKHEKKRRVRRCM